MGVGRFVVQRRFFAEDYIKLRRMLGRRNLSFLCIVFADPRLKILDAVERSRPAVAARCDGKRHLTATAALAVRAKWTFGIRQRPKR
jgi:hypothetical protein